MGDVMILISKTYETVTQDSAEAGEAEDSGFVFEDESMTFRELIGEIHRGGYCYSSSYPCYGRAGDCLTTEADIDYQTGEQTSYSLHFSHNNNPRLERYWRKALQYVRLAK
jgi:hypothetical protein